MPSEGWLLINQSLTDKISVMNFVINAALLNVYFILHYHSINFFVKKFIILNYHFSVNTIFECIYIIFGWERGHQLSAYATGGEIGGSSKMHKAAYRVMEWHASFVLTHLHYICSCFWQHFCLMVSCSVCRNLTLPFIKKDVFIRNGYFSPTR